MKKLLISFLLLFIVIIVGFMLISIQKKVNENEDMSKRIASIYLPENITCVQRDSSVDEKKETVIIIFYAPGCDYCESMLESFEREQKSKNGVQLYLISSTSHSEIESDLANYTFTELSSYCFLSDQGDLLAKHYAISSYPETFVYDDGLLQDHLKGELDAGILWNKISNY